jgi:GT2 family glycosyltransferase
MSTVVASIVIPTFRRNDLLARCLDAACDQSFPADRYEVIVADDAAAEDTARLVRQYDQRSPCAVRYVPVCGSHGPAAARNAGWRVANGAFLAFTDDDCVPDRGWLAAGVRSLEAGPKEAAAWGRLEMPLPPEPSDYERDASGLAQAVFVTANCFVTRAAIEEVDGFDERFQVAWREDSDLYYSLLEQGVPIVHQPDALVVHPIRAAPWGVSLKQQRKSVFDVLLYRKHPKLYRQHVPPFPLLYLGTVGAGLSALIGLALGQFAWSAAAGIVWLLLTLRFALMRLAGTKHSASHIAEMLLTSALIPWLAIVYRAIGLWRFGSLRVGL